MRYQGEPTFWRISGLYHDFFWFSVIFAINPIYKGKIQKPAKQWHWGLILGLFFWDLANFFSFLSTIQQNGYHSSSFHYKVQQSMQMTTK